MMDEWVYDTREKNAWLVIHATAEGWQRARLTLSFFKVVGDGEDDFDCADFTNTNGDGMVEFKDIGDFVGTFGRGGMRGTEQIVKMTATGIPACVVVHGNEAKFRQRAGAIGEKSITNAKQKALSLSARYHVPFMFAVDPAEAVEIAKTFVRKAREFPRGMPVWNEWKPKRTDVPVAMLCGIPDIGPEQARRVLSAYPSLMDLGAEIHRDEAGVKHRLDEVYGIGPVTAAKVIAGLKQEVAE